MKVNQKRNSRVLRKNKVLTRKNKVYTSERFKPDNKDEDNDDEEEEYNRSKLSDIEE